MNSANQRWSYWKVCVTPGRVQPARHAPDTVRQLATFVRAHFGLATQMNVHTAPGQLTLEVRSDGRLDAHDPDCVQFLRERFQEFFERACGPGTTTTLTGKLEAGSRQDGSPPEQLIMLPRFSEMQHG